MTIAVTRKLKQHSLELLLGANIEVQDKSLFLYKNLPIDLTLLEQKNAVITSKNAVSALSHLLKSKKISFNKIFAIEGSTSVALKESGCKNLSTASTSALLAEKIVKSGIAEISHYSCSERLPYMEQILGQYNIQYSYVETYEKNPQAFSFGEHRLACFFSPSQVRRYAASYNLNSLDRIYSIGPTTSLEVRNFTDIEIYSAKRHTEEDLIQLIIHTERKKSVVK